MQLRRLYPDFFASKHNLLLAFATDGMCPWVDKKSMSFWSKLYMIMNLPFFQRWRLANIIVSGLSHNSVNGQPRNFNTPSSLCRRPARWLGDWVPCAYRRR